MPENTLFTYKRLNFTFKVVKKKELIMVNGISTVSVPQQVYPQSQVGYNTNYLATQPIPQDEVSFGQGSQTKSKKGNPLKTLLGLGAIAAGTVALYKTGKLDKLLKKARNGLDKLLKNNSSKKSSKTIAKHLKSKNNPVKNQANLTKIKKTQKEQTKKAVSEFIEKHNIKNAEQYRKAKSSVSDKGKIVKHKRH